MNNLITGGAGFIGSHLAEILLSKGEKVCALDDLSTGRIKNIEHLNENKNFNFIYGSIVENRIASELINNCDAVYHLAASVGVNLIIDKPLESLINNIKTTETVLEVSSKWQKKVLLTSSSEVYGKNDNLPFSESDDRVYGSVYSTRWGYAYSKSIDEFLGLAYYREKGLPVVVARLFNTVGPRQTGNYGMVIPRFINQAMKNLPITVYGDGKQSRSFSYVTDIVKGLISLMKSEKTSGEVYNVGSNNEISIIDLARKIKEKTKSKSKIVLVNYDEAYEKGFEDMIRRKPKLEKIKSVINYNPKTNLDQIIEILINSYK